ncbi:MAG TPA: choice-of-anchor P family protein [Thermoanaerobaculia bacterium]
MKSHHIFFIFMLLLLAAFTPSAALANSFSGQATVVQATVLGQTIPPLADTGPLPPEGGSQEASLVDADVGFLSAHALHATAVAMGDASRSEAAVANVNLMVAGNTITADFLMARAAAFCDQGKASASGSSELAKLVINGDPITITGGPQTIPLPVGEVRINEQSQNVQGNKAEITVNVLHVLIPGVADVIIASAHADITCTGKVCPADRDFVTGGGWYTNGSGRATFAVAGGIKNGGGWGHLAYIDHGSGMKVKGTGVTDYIITGETSRRIKGTCEINGVGGTYTVDVNDAGEPGRDDTFYIQLSNGYTSGRKLEGGNIQLHTCK